MLDLIKLSHAITAGLPPDASESTRMRAERTDQSSHNECAFLQAYADRLEKRGGCRHVPHAPHAPHAQPPCMPCDLAFQVILSTMHNRWSELSAVATWCAAGSHVLGPPALLTYSTTPQSTGYPGPRFCCTSPTHQRRTRPNGAPCLCSFYHIKSTRFPYCVVFTPPKPEKAGHKHGTCRTPDLHALGAQDPQDAVRAGGQQRCDAAARVAVVVEAGTYMIYIYIYIYIYI